MKKKIGHKHLLIRAEIESAPLESPEEEHFLNDTIRNLIHDIGMKVVLKPRCVYVGEEGNEGYTGQAGLETSHIAYHIWNHPDRYLVTNVESGLIQMDVYTCGCLDEEQIIKIVHWVDDSFGIRELDLALINREHTIEGGSIRITGYDSDDKNIEQFFKG